MFLLRRCINTNGQQAREKMISPLTIHEMKNKTTTKLSPYIQQDDQKVKKADNNPC